MRHYLQAARRSILLHGGGMRGFWAILRRAQKIIAAMGVGGLLSRLRSASTTRPAITDAADQLTLPEPVPLVELELRVGVMAHVFYPDLIDEFITTLQHVPVPFTLLVSVMDQAAADQINSRVKTLPNVQALVVKIVENQGRDIAPFLVSFHKEILDLDVVAHIHTKKSLYTGHEQQDWRQYLLGGLFGSRERTGWILGMFQAMPSLGLVYPESHHSVPLWAHTWLSNKTVCDHLAARLGFSLEPNRYIDFPAGSMFWARVAALRPLFDLQLKLQDFPAEQGQVDGTLQHAVERLFGQICRHHGFSLGILPADGTLALAAEGQRNVATALELPIAQRLQLAALDATTLSTDVFDTLVVRPFLTPTASRAHLSWRIERQFGIKGFAQHREAAEGRMRLVLQRDPTLHEIHQQLSDHLDLAHLQPGALMQAELDHERQQLRPRSGVLDALRHASPAQQIALSDMYLTRADMQQVLPTEVTAAFAQWRISCETGLRKDELRSWPQLARNHDIDVSHWLHVGDNEHADVQLPQLAKLLTPVHVLRPAALLDVIPALRALRHPLGTNAPWPEQFWRGLLANRFAAILDAAPQRLQGRPQLDAEDLGYVVLGPLLLDFLLAMLRAAAHHQASSLLFLSREGYLLEKAFARLRPFHELASQLPAAYLLASRKATSLFPLRQTADLGLLLEGTFNGTLEELLQARVGQDAVFAVAAADPNLLPRNIFLPEMADTIAGWLQPAAPRLLELAANARDTYHAYWAATDDGESPMVVDIGYAGTIQRNLSQVHQRPLGGYYFALRSRARQLDQTGWAQVRYFDGRQGAAESGSPILVNDLLLEALLAAPSGQFNGFEPAEGGGLKPSFGPIELTENGLQALALAHQGALQFIDDACAMLGTDIAELALDPAGVQRPLQCLASGRWDADATLQRLATDDSFTGRGKVAAGTAST